MRWFARVRKGSRNWVDAETDGALPPNSGSTAAVVAVVVVVVTVLLILIAVAMFSRMGSFDRPPAP